MADSKKVASRTEKGPPRQRRAVLTRDDLLRSARRIFARDGFEHARLEDIAASAGKTRGAFYTNFKSKEDVFFAIFEENAERDLAELVPRLAAIRRVADRIEALGEYLVEVSRDRERILLNLEFKLYAIRHPRRRPRLARVHTAVLLCTCVVELGELIPVLKQRSPQGSMMVSLAISSLVDGLALNHFFDPENLNREDMARQLKQSLHTTLRELKS